MGRIAAIVAVAVMLAAMPAAVVAAPQPNPFLPQAEQPQGTQEAPQQQEAPAQAPAQQQTESDSGIGGTTIALVVIGLLVLIGGVWTVIVRDARRATQGRVRMQSARGGDPDAARRAATRPAPRGRKPSPAERRRRKRGRAR